MNIQQQAAASQFMKVGEYTYGPEINIRIWTEFKSGSIVKIGKYCSLADNITVFLGGNHRLDWISTYAFKIIGHKYALPPDTKGDIVIENDVWVGSGATILSGVTVGSGAAIGACSVVASDIPPYCVAVGNPVRVIRKRFPDDDIEWLLDIRWWDWPVEKVRKYAKFLTSNDIQGFRLAVKNE